MHIHAEWTWMAMQLMNALQQKLTRKKRLTSGHKRRKEFKYMSSQGEVAHSHKFTQKLKLRSHSTHPEQGVRSGGYHPNGPWTHATITIISWVLWQKQISYYSCTYRVELHCTLRCTLRTNSAWSSSVLRSVQFNAVFKISQEIRVQKTYRMGSTYYNTEGEHMPHHLNVM